MTTYKNVLLNIFKEEKARRGHAGTVELVAHYMLDRLASTNVKNPLQYATKVTLTALIPGVLKIAEVTEEEVLAEMADILNGEKQ